MQHTTISDIISSNVKSREARIQKTCPHLAKRLLNPDQRHVDWERLHQWPKTWVELSGPTCEQKASHRICTPLMFPSLLSSRHHSPDTERQAIAAICCYVILELRTNTSRLRLPSTGLTVPLCKRPKGHKDSLTLSLLAGVFWQFKFLRVSFVVLTFFKSRNVAIQTTHNNTTNLHYL